MKNITLLMLMTLVLSIGMISASSLSIANSTGVVKITLDSTGKINASSTIAENGVLLSSTYLALAGGTLTGNIVMTNNNVSAKYFIGNGSQLTDVVATVASNSVVIAGENITSGTIAFARLPSLTNTHTLDYLNLTGTVPSAWTTTYNVTYAGYSFGARNETLDTYNTYNTAWLSTYNATYATHIPSTNVAFVNQTNIFAVNQNMSDKNITTVDCIVFTSGGKICDSA